MKDEQKRKALEKAATKMLKADDRFQKLKSLFEKKKAIYKKITNKQNGDH